MIAVLTFRALPFVLHALFSPRLAPGAKALWLLAFACSVALGIGAGAMALDEVVAAPFALGYFALLGLIVHDGVSRFANRLSPLLVLLLLVGSCLLLPGLILAHPLLVPTLVLGWEVMLSAYSFWMESSAKAPASRRDCLFFLLVNPALVYREHGEPFDGSGRFRVGAIRCVTGIVALAGQASVVTVVGSKEIANPLQTLRGESVMEYLNLLYLYSGIFVAYYLAQSGLASFRIGLGAFSGYRIPECYRYPFVSTSPSEFWLRWNLWVGAWARRYLFFPISLAIGRRFRRASAAIGSILAAMLTFLTVGILHDFAKYCMRLGERGAYPPSPKGLVLFGLSGLLLLLWAGFRRVLETIDSPFLARWPRAVNVIGIVAFFHSLYFVHAATLWLLPSATTKPGGW